MNKLLMLVLAGMLLGPQLLYADEQAEQPGFWENLKSKLESLTPSEDASKTTVTGGVRGAPMASDDMYWKGEVKEQAVDAEELAAFKKAVDLFESGDKTQARTEFTAFISKYPDSPLRKDAEQALALSAP